MLIVIQSEINSTETTGFAYVYVIDRRFYLSESMKQRGKRTSDNGGTYI